MTLLSAQDLPHIAFSGVGAFKAVTVNSTVLLTRTARRARFCVLKRIAPAIQKGTRVLISLWHLLMFGRVPGIARRAATADRSFTSALLI